MNSRYLLAIVTGGLIAGLLDITFAISWAAYNGTGPVKLLQIVASGLFGKPAFEGGMAMAAWGLALHFGMSLLWACVFLAAATRLPALAQHPFIAGAVFGVIVFLVMRLVVLPLSAFPFPVSFKPLDTVLDLMSHMFLFGVPIALAARRAVAP